MIYHQFPDLQWLKIQTEGRFSNRKAWDGRSLDNPGWPNVILNVSAQQVHRDNIRGPMSIFTNISGKSHVEINNKRSTINEGFFYITNPDQHYTLDIQNQAQTFNIHFGEYFSEQVFQSLTKTPETLLENSSDIPLQRLTFHNRLQHQSPEINQRILFLHANKPSGILLEEQLVALISIILKQERKLHTNLSELPVLKSTTRAEIAKRLITATDYIYTYFDRDLTLDELAAASCLSKFHFLRLFKIAFLKTPHHFINEVRVLRGRELLRNTRLDIKSISRIVGFDASSSFSRVFFQHTGVYPAHFRLQCQ
jgi:AraC family transcriptional regulator